MPRADGGGDGLSGVHVGEFNLVVGMDFDEELGVLVGGVGFEFVDFAGGFVGCPRVHWCDRIAIFIPRFAVFSAEPCFGFDASAEMGCEGVDEGFILLVAVGDDEGVGADGGLGSCDGFFELDACGHECFVVEKIAQDDIAHAEATGGGWGAAEEFDEVVVATAAGDGSFAVGDGFEDGAGVVGEASCDGEIFGNPRIKIGHRARRAHRVQVGGIEIGRDIEVGEKGDEGGREVGVGGEDLEGVGGEFGFSIEEGEGGIELIVGDAE